MEQGRADVSAAAALSLAGPLTRPIVEAFESLSPQLRTAARYVLDQPDDVALLSMREQACRAGVPPATMTRLAKRLGLEGYDEVRALYAGAVRDGTLGFAGKAGVQVEARKPHGEPAPALVMVQSLGRQIARLAEPAALDRLADAAGRLHEARRIYCLGLRSCHAAGGHFHYVLALLGDKAVMLEDAGGTGLDPLRDAGREDVLLAASVEPHAHATIEAARYAATEGVPVVALTDSEVSPLARSPRPRSWRRSSPADPAKRRSTPSPAPRRSLWPSVSTRRAAARASPHDLIFSPR